MLKKIVWLCFYCITIFDMEFCFADVPMIKRKCAIYPPINSPSTKNYAFIEYNERKAITYTYFRSPFSGTFGLFKFHYKFLAKAENNSNVLLYLHPNNNAILAIDTVRHVASKANEMLSAMPSDISAQEHVLFNETFKYSASEKTGATAEGYYCNINQNTEFPTWDSEITDNYDNL